MVKMLRYVNRDVAGSYDVQNTYGNIPSRELEYILNALAYCNLMVYMVRTSSKEYASFRP